MGILIGGADVPVPVPESLAAPLEALPFSSQERSCDWPMEREGLGSVYRRGAACLPSGTPVALGVPHYHAPGDLERLGGTWSAHTTGPLLCTRKSNNNWGFSDLFEDGGLSAGHIRGAQGRLIFVPCACLLSQQSETGRDRVLLEALWRRWRTQEAKWRWLCSHGASTPDELVTCPRSPEQLQPLRDHP
jgi:hypothetical protein